MPIEKAPPRPRRLGINRKCNAPSLLRTVNGTTHATDEDHEPDPAWANSKSAHAVKVPQPSTLPNGSLPTSDSLQSSRSDSPRERKKRKSEVEEDIDRDPDSSSDEEDAKMRRNASSNFRMPHTIAPGEYDIQSGSAQSFRQPGPSWESRESGLNGKRNSSEAGSDEPEWMASTHPSKKRKGMPKGRLAPLPNIFAPAPQHRRMYGSKHSVPRTTVKVKVPKKSNRARLEDQPEKNASGFKVPEAFPSPERSDATSFRSPFSSLVEPGEDNPDLDDSSPLSSAGNSPMAEDVATLGLPKPTPYTSTIQCDWCEEEISKIAFEEFLDSYGLEEPMPFRWKAFFCRHHKRERAEEERAAKGFPRIDWGRLGGRMRKHDEYLRGILHNTTGSHYRTAQRDKLLPRHKGLQQFQQKWDDENEKPGGSVGYYGPKGAKIMTDHIMDSLADELRERATIDRLMSSSGVQGGVTGFVQAVLVPHLAELLITDDMRLSGDDWSQRARDIIAESTDLGELLYPEAKDQIIEEEPDADDD